MSTFDRDAVGVFRFVRCRFSADTGVAELAYAFDHGPELAALLPLIGRQRVLDRLE